MITKTGEELTKRSSLAVEIPLAVAIHAGQNIATGARLAKTQKGSQFYRDMLNGVMNGGKTKMQNPFMEGAINGAVPELKMTEDQVVHYTEWLKDKMRNRGVDVDNLSKRDIVRLRQVLRGDFEKAVGRRNLERMHEAGQLGSDVRTTYKYLDRDATGQKMVSALGESLGLSEDEMLEVMNRGGAPFLRELGDAWKRNKLFGRLGEGLANQMDAKTLREFHGYKPGTPVGPGEYGRAVPDMEKQESKLRAAKETLGVVGANAALAAVDPFAFGATAGKLLLDRHEVDALFAKGKEVGYLPGAIMRVPGHIKNFIGEWTMFRPMRKAYNRGVSTGEYGTTMLEKAKAEATRYGSNYLTQGLTDMAGDFGNALYHAGLRMQPWGKGSKRGIGLAKDFDRKMHEFADQRADRTFGLQAPDEHPTLQSIIDSKKVVGQPKTR